MSAASLLMAMNSVKRLTGLTKVVFAILPKAQINCGGLSDSGSITQALPDDTASQLGLGAINPIDGIDLLDYTCICIVRDAAGRVANETFGVTAKLTGSVAFPSITAIAYRNNAGANSLVLTVDVLIFPSNPERLRL